MQSPFTCFFHLPNGVSAVANALASLTTRPRYFHFLCRTALEIKGC